MTGFCIVHISETPLSKLLDPQFDDLFALDVFLNLVLTQKNNLDLYLGHCGGCKIFSAVC